LSRAVATSSSRAHARRAIAVVGSVAVLAASPVAIGASAPEPVAARILIGLDRDTAGLEAAARAVSDPAGPAYRDHSTVGALAQRYGASDATVAKVRRELARAGFPRAILEVTRGFLVVPATASQLNEMNGRSREMERAPRRALAIARIRSGAGGLVQEIVTDPVVPHPAARAAGTTRRPSFKGQTWPSRTGAPRGCAKGISTPLPPSGRPEMIAAFPESKVFTPNQFQTAFGLTPLHRAGVRGKGQHIALFEVTAGVKRADMITFARCFGLPAPDLRIVPVGQSTPVSPLISFATVEAHLDVQAVMMAAPGARISVVEGTGITSMPEVMSAALDARRMRGVPDVLSVSYGVCEALVQGGSDAPFLSGPGARRLTDWVLATAAGAGVTTLVAAGDSGAQGCAHNLGRVPNGPSAPDAIAFAATNYVSYPASSLWATAVGGTTMTLTKGNAIRTQAPWNDRTSIGVAPMEPQVVDGQPVITFAAAGGTGGNSQLYGTPGYQTAYGIRSTRRLVPDVSMFASWGIPLVCSAYDASTGQGPCPPGAVTWPFMSVAGTSFAAPLLAGAVALANQRAEAAGQARIGFANPLLYSSGRSAIRDVTTGNNDVFGTGRCCFAGPGYDQATGLGTVNATRLAQAAVRAGG